MGEAEVALDRLLRAARPFAHCTAGWQGRGYGSPLIYTCLTRERDIADPDHATFDWWPLNGPCGGCELTRVLRDEGWFDAQESRPPTSRDTDTPPTSTLGPDA